MDDAGWLLTLSGGPRCNLVMTEVPRRGRCCDAWRSLRAGTSPGVGAARGASPRHDAVRGQVVGDGRDDSDEHDRPVDLGEGPSAGRSGDQSARDVHVPPGPTASRRNGATGGRRRDLDEMAGRALGGCASCRCCRAAACRRCRATGGRRPSPSRWSGSRYRWWPTHPARPDPSPGRRRRTAPSARRGSGCRRAPRWRRYVDAVSDDGRAAAFPWRRARSVPR